MVAVCASASTMSTPGMTGLPGKCPANHQSSSRERADGHAAHAGLAVHDFVDEEERRTVRQQREHLLVSQLHSGFSSLVRRR